MVLPQEGCRELTPSLWWRQYSLLLCRSSRSITSHGLATVGAGVTVGGGGAGVGVGAVVAGGGAVVVEAGAATMTEVGLAAAGGTVVDPWGAPGWDRGPVWLVTPVPA